MPATEKRILIPSDAPRRSELERALQAEGWKPLTYVGVGDVQTALTLGRADAVVLRAASNRPAEMELVKVVRRLSPESFVIGFDPSPEGCDTALAPESSPREVAVAARLGAALRELRSAERQLREQLQTVEDRNRAHIERIRELEVQCTTLQEWSRNAQEMALHDDLTGLYNRRYFLQAAEAELERSRRKNGRFAIAMIDIDRFKLYNDTYGHAIGDQILKRFAGVLVAALRRMDTVARYGGEEFVMLLPETVGAGDGFDAVRLIERLRQAIEKADFLDGPKRIETPITISAGVVTYPQDGSDVNELLLEADARMYRAKAAGRNRVCASPERGQGDPSEAV